MKGANLNKKPAYKKILQCWQLYVMLLPAVLYFVLFKYLPMAGVQIAFRDYRAVDGIWGSEWVGLKHFERFINSIQFETLISNTLRISVTSLIVGFPLPIILAILLNETRSPKLKKMVQNITYAPHFISTVVLVGMVNMFLSPSSGLINNIIEAFGGEAVNFLAKEEAFLPTYIISGQWQNLGWNAIVYVAALANVDTTLYDAAKVDGANRFHKIWYIDLPAIMPTAVLLLIMNSGNILNVGYEKTYLMQNPLNTTVSEIISTYVYKVGLINAKYSYTAAIGLFNSVINVIVLLIVNKIAKKFSDTSLF